MWPVSSHSLKAREQIVWKLSLNLFVSTALLGFLHLMLLGHLCLHLPWIGQASLAQ